MDRKPIKSTDKKPEIYVPRVWVSDFATAWRVAHELGWINYDNIFNNNIVEEKK